MVLKFTTKGDRNNNHSILRIYIESKRYTFQVCKAKGDGCILVSREALNLLLTKVKSEGYTDLYKEDSQDEA